MSGQWEGSTRSSDLPPEWAPVIRPAILERDGHQCTWIEGEHEGGLTTYLAGTYNPDDRCTARATDVDHAGDRDDHRPEVLRALCSWHHDRKSSAEGNAARTRITTKRAKAKHPGLVE
jgi:5-methylcytosine-specific restriction enzyme A